MEIERWFQGTVVDINDPMKMGRVKIRELVGQTLEERQRIRGFCYWII